MIVYLIRHGQTKGNVEHIHQGWADDFELTETGREQATALRNKITKKKFDRIICSDVLRTRQTCAIIFGEDAVVEYDARLREIDNNVISGKRRADLYEMYGDEYAENCHKLDFSFFGGESGDSMVKRTGEFLKYLESDTESKRIAVVTHGGTIHGILANILHMPLYCPFVKIDNCSVTKLEFKKGAWSLVHVNNKIEF